MPLSLGVKLDSQSSNEKIQKKNDLYRIVKTFDLTYFVVSDTVGQDFTEVRLAVGVPTHGMLLNGGYCMDIAGTVIDRVRHPVTASPCELWGVTCKFTSDYDPSREPKDDPVDMRPKVRWYTEIQNEVMDEEARNTGWAVQTENGEKILVERGMVITCLEITRNEIGPTDPNNILLYANHVNKKKFWGVPPGCALMVGPTTSEFFHEGRLYIEVVYTIKFKFWRDEEGDIRQDSWAARVLHQGIRPLKSRSA